MKAKWEWDDVRFFLATARERTLSGAARTLGVDHVTVGRRLAALEEKLRAKLLTKTREGFATTPVGQAILQDCEAMEVAAANLERLAAGHDARIAGSVSVTTTDALAHAIIVPAIVTLRQRHPDLQIDLLPGVRTMDVARREVDLAVRISPTRPTASGLICRKLGEIGFALYASPDYLAARGTPNRGEGLHGHDLISYAGWPTVIGPPFMGESLNGAQTSIRSNDRFIQLRATAVGLGISELACFLGDDHPALVRVWPDQSPVSRLVWLIMHEDLRRAARIRLVASAIVDAFQENAKLLRRGKRPARG